jgi:4-amino-4-deoxychorismate lyase
MLEITTPEQIRILLDKNGYFRGSAVPTTPNSAPDLIAAARYHPTTGLAPDVLGPVLHIVMDHLPTPSSIFTRTKTDHREQYDAARKRTGVPPLGVVPASSAPNDVLLYNEAGSVTETTIRNVAFFRDRRWVTPHADTGCLVGVVRRHLLHQGLVDEADNASALLANGVQSDEVILLFNAVEGCRLGRVVLRGPHSGFDRPGGQDSATK